MLTAILLAAQFSIPATMIPEPGAIVCDERATICILRFEDASTSVMERQAMRTALEGERRANAILKQHLVEKCTAKLEVVEPPKKPKEPRK